MVNIPLCYAMPLVDNDDDGDEDEDDLKDDDDIALYITNIQARSS